MSKAARSLVAALRAALNFDGAVEVRELESRPWWSATFSGARHQMALTLSGDGAAAAADAFVADLMELEFPMSGRFVADIALAERIDATEGVRLCLEVLTIED